MRSLVGATVKSLLAVAVLAAPAVAQSKTLLYDHVHMSVPDPEAAAQWYHDHIGGEWVDGRTDRLIFGTTRIMWLRGENRRPSEGSVIDHLGFSYPDLAAKLAELGAAGATVTPAREVPGLFTLAFITDPFGTRLELVQDPQHLGFHHVHLRSQDPAATLDWYEEMFGGVRLSMRGRLEGILYPGNVWILVQRGETFPSTEGSIDHIGWRSPETTSNLERLTGNGAELRTQPRDMTLPNGQIRFFYIQGPEGANIELVERQPDMR
jgi:catechol 2,3-dioxygenase-like lactoylglutathione lyase family enzyme